ncbi:sensor domain-containing protein [Mycobacterium sp. MMS18-G62]
MRSSRSAIAAMSACVVLAGCASAVEGAPAVHIVDAAKPSVSRSLDQVLPTVDELATTLGTGGFMGQLVKGGPDMLLQGVGESDATPADCVSPTYRLQKVVYQASPVRSVASQSWAGGDASGPSASGFFGVVQFASADDAQRFFAASADKWHRCNGQTLVVHQPQHGADGLSRIADVVVGNRVVSAVVMRDAGSTIQRALGVAADCVVDVEVSDAGNGSADAIKVANLMVQKIGAP